MIVNIRVYGLGFNMFQCCNYCYCYCCDVQYNSTITDITVASITAVALRCAMV